jgi:hypothetical protein
MTLFAVATVHVALIALIVMMTAMSRISDPSLQPIQLVYVPAVPPPPVRADSGRPPRLRADIALSPLAPVIASAPPASNSSATGRRGAGVDWAAEAHRAVKAYEIRRDQPGENSLSGKSPANDWWPRQGPHAGDQYKNDAGDWIVWINADCYQVAGWHSVDPASNLSTAQIVCPGKSPSPAKSDVSPASP